MLHMQSIIDSAVEKNNQVRSGQREGARFHVSDAGTCYRKRFLKRLGIEPARTIPVNNLRKMVAGDAGHEKLQSLLGKYGNMFASENSIGTEHILGHYDGIIIDDNQKALVEFKTIEKWSMTYIRKDGAKPEHEIQMFTYWMFLREHIKDLDQAILSYVMREDFTALDFNYTWSDEIEKKVQAEWKPLIKYWIDKELPPCTCDQDYGGNGIKYCLYQEDDEHCCNEKLYHDYLKNMEIKK